MFNGQYGYGYNGPSGYNKYQGYGRSGYLGQGHSRTNYVTSDGYIPQFDPNH